MILEQVNGASAWNLKSSYDSVEVGRILLASQQET